MKWMVMMLLSVTVGAEAETFLTQADARLQCQSTSFTLGYNWEEVSADTTVSVLSVNSDGIVPPIPSAYQTFSVDNELFPDSTVLVIENISIEEAGTYRCNTFPITIATDFDVQVEALPAQKVSIDCTTSSSPGACPSSPAGSISSEFTCTCTATGVYPESLDFVWSNVNSSSTSTKVDDGSGLFVITGNARVRPSGAVISCTLGEYSNAEAQQSTLTENEYQFDPPECTLESSAITADTDCSAVELTCECGDPAAGTTYQFYNGDELLVTSPPSSKTITVDTTFHESSMYYCRPCNDIYYDPGSTGEKEVTCPPATTTQAPSPKPTTEREDDSREDAGSSSFGLITGWILAAVLAVALVVLAFLYHKKKPASDDSMEIGQSSTVASQEMGPGARNTAYMDLRKKAEADDKIGFLAEIPETNVSILSDFPCGGLMLYCKVNINGNSRSDVAVSKTLSDAAPIALSKLWHAEIKILLELPKHHNVVEVLGWCNAVPNSLITELSDGGSLLRHLSDNFSPHKLHHYGNIERKKFAVPERGYPENLPKYALDVSRGLRFLLINKFIHPGLRAEKVLIDSAGRCKLYDIVSIERAEKVTSLLWRESAPYQWMSPEYLLLGTLAPAGDVWSFGVLLWEIFSYGSQPYPGESRDAVENSLRKSGRLPMPQNCPGAIWQLMIQCWEQSPERRSELEEITTKLSTMCHENKEYEEIPNQRPIV